MTDLSTDETESVTSDSDDHEYIEPPIEENEEEEDDAHDEHDDGIQFYNKFMIIF